MWDSLLASAANMHTWRAVAALGFAHAAIDATTGFALASLVESITPVRLVILIAAYNAIAFLLQPLVGLAVDRIRAPHLAAVLGLATAGLGMFAASIHPWIGVAFMGLGSALFHVSGGALACAATPGRSVGPGFFTGPGVIGLSVGTACGLALQGADVFIVAALIIAIIAVTKTTMAAHIAERRVSLSFSPVIAIAVAALVIGTAARSSVWTATQTVFMHDVGILLVLGIAAGVGKMLGGIAGDKLGARVAVIGSLVIGCSLFLAPTPGRFVLAILFLQSSTPIILAAVVRRMPRFPATATGLVLGFALALGGLFLMQSSPEHLLADGMKTILLAGAVLLFFVGLTLIRQRRDA